MGFPGRKPKPGLREPNGRLQRPTTQAALNALAEKARRREQAVVLAQPHRRGEASPLAESPLGRLCLRNKLKRELYDAGMQYGSIVASWRSAKGVPMATDRGSGQGGEGPSDEKVRRWQTRMIEIERAVTREGGIEALLTLRTLVLDEAEPGIERDAIAVLALEAAAIELGLMEENPMPFAA